MFTGKKDAEGWETVQRGRTAKPRSAAMVAKVSPVLACVTPKQDSNKGNQSRVPPQANEQLRPECPRHKDVSQTDTKQQIPSEPEPQEEVEGPKNGQIMEVLMFSTL